MARAKPRTSTDTDTEKDDKDDTTEPDPEETTDDDASNGENGADGVGLEDRIRQIVREIVEPLVGRRPNPRTRTDEEDTTTQQVRAALDQLRTEEEREQRFKNVEEKLDKVTERPPAPTGIMGKVQRAMWGEKE